VVGGGGCLAGLILHCCCLISFIFSFPGPVPVRCLGVRGLSGAGVTTVVPVQEETMILSYYIK